MKFLFGPSLPPSVEGKQKGQVELTVRQFSWLSSSSSSTSAPSKQPVLRVKWWGDRTGGTVIRFSSPRPNVFVADHVLVHPVFVSETAFQRYLSDMGALAVFLEDPATSEFVGSTYIPIHKLCTDKVDSSFAMYSEEGVKVARIDLSAAASFEPRSDQTSPPGPAGVAAPAGPTSTASAASRVTSSTPVDPSNIGSLPALHSSVSQSYNNFLLTHAGTVASGSAAGASAGATALGDNTIEPEVIDIMDLYDETLRLKEELDEYGEEEPDPGRGFLRSTFNELRDPARQPVTDGALFLARLRKGPPAFAIDETDDGWESASTDSSLPDLERDFEHDDYVLDETEFPEPYVQGLPSSERAASSAGHDNMGNIAIPASMDEVNHPAINSAASSAVAEPVEMLEHALTLEHALATAPKSALASQPVTCTVPLFLLVQALLLDLGRSVYEPDRDAYRLLLRIPGQTIMVPIKRTLRKRLVLNLMKIFRVQGSHEPLSVVFELWNHQSLLGIAPLPSALLTSTLANTAGFYTLSLVNPFTAREVSRLNLYTAVGSGDFVRSTGDRSVAARTLQDFARRICLFRYIERLSTKPIPTAIVNVQSSVRSEISSLDASAHEVADTGPDHRSMQQDEVLMPLLDEHVHASALPSPIRPVSSARPETALLDGDLLPLSGAAEPELDLDSALQHEIARRSVVRFAPEAEPHQDGFSIDSGVAQVYKKLRLFLPAQSIVRVVVVQCRGLKAAALEVRNTTPELEFASTVGVNAFVRFSLFPGNPSSSGSQSSYMSRQTGVVGRSFCPRFDFSDSTALYISEDVFGFLWNGCASFELWHMFPQNRMMFGSSNVHSEVKLCSCSVPLRNLLQSSGSDGQAGINGWFQLLTDNGHFVGSIELRMSLDRDTVSAVQECLTRIAMHAPSSCVADNVDLGSLRRSLEQLKSSPRYLSSSSESSESSVALDNTVRLHAHARSRHAASVAPAFDKIARLTVLVDHATLNVTDPTVAAQYVQYESFWVTFSMYGEPGQLQTPMRDLLTNGRIKFLYSKEFVKPKTPELIQFFTGAQMAFTLRGRTRTGDEVDLGVCFCTTAPLLDSSSAPGPTVSTSSAASLSFLLQATTSKRLRHVGGVLPLLSKDLSDTLPHKLCVRVLYEEMDVAANPEDAALVDELDDEDSEPLDPVLRRSIALASDRHPSREFTSYVPTSAGYGTCSTLEYLRTVPRVPPEPLSPETDALSGLPKEELLQKLRQNMSDLEAIQDKFRRKLLTGSYSLE